MDSDSFFRTSHSSPLIIGVLDGHETLVEKDVFHAGEEYAGAIRARTEIEIVRITAKIERPDVAERAALYIDDLTFGSELKAKY
ncbi:MAG: hypothetical protein JO232_06155 [Verrucomicrobia bacterium]|nr:hypothetical protein [Verrucomicrobiota bacterium]